MKQGPRGATQFYWVCGKGGEGRGDRKPEGGGGGAGRSEMAGNIGPGIGGGGVFAGQPIFLIQSKI